MLHEWHDETSLAHQTDAKEDEVGDMLSWCSASGWPTVNEHLKIDQNADVNKLLKEYSNVFSNKLGNTTLAEHRIETGYATPCKLHVKYIMPLRCLFLLL